MKEITWNGEKRYKKAGLNHFASKWQKMDVRGKSSKELKEMVVELQKVNRYLKRSVDALAYKEGEAKKLVTKTRNQSETTANKLVRRAKSVERMIAREKTKESLREAKNELEGAKSDWRNAFKKQGELEQQVFDLTEALKTARNEPTQLLVDEVNKWKTKYDEAAARSIRNSQRKQRVKTIKVPVEVERQKTVDEYKAEKFMNYVSTPLSDRLVNISDMVLKAVSFMQESGISIDDISMIIKANLLGNFTADQFGVRTRRLSQLEAKGLLSRNSTGAFNRGTYWYVSPDGKSTIKKLTDYISYGKTKL